MSAKNQDWHAEQIKAAVRMKGKVVALLFLVIMTPDSNRMVMVFWMFTLIVSEYSAFRMELLLLLKTFRQVIVKSSRYPAPTPPQRMQRLIYGVLQPVQ